MAPSPEPSPRCRSRTQSGKPCRNRPKAGTDRCQRHSIGIVVQLPPGKADPDAESRGPNETALITTLEAFGQPTDTDAARWQMLRSLARAVDTAPAKAALWEQYREALSELMKDINDGDDSLEEAVKALASASEVGNTKKR